MTRAAVRAALAVLTVAGPLALSRAAGVSAQARVWQGTFDWPAYAEGLPDPNPPFPYFRRGRINYPYTIRENLTGRREARGHRALFLENAYLRCTVLPDVGGHLYSCTDKRNGEEMFYANPSLKLTQIGYRGAWAAFGVEFNFPVSHNWMSTSPVDFATTRRGDGSVSAWVGNVDRVTGMQWTVELTLEPGRAALEQRTTLYNRSPFRHRFYWWTNAAVRVWDDSRVLYPQRWTASHGFRDIDTWPVDSRGTDNSVVGNHLLGPVSRFAHGSREAYMAVWHPRTRAGTVHYSSPTDLPAKKVWSFGGDPAGLNWRRALSDDNSAYVEIQAGLFRNQETYAFLEPQDRIVFTETWLPIRSLGGVSRANPHAVAHVERTGAGLRVALEVAEAHPGARVLVEAGGRTLLERVVDLSPDTLFEAVVPAADVPAAGPPATLTVAPASGPPFLVHTEGVYDFADPATVEVGPVPARAPPPDTATWGAATFQEAANDLERDGRLIEASALWRRGRAAHPDALGLALGDGRLSVVLNRPLKYPTPAAGGVDRESVDSGYAIVLPSSWGGDVPEEGP